MFRKITEAIDAFRPRERRDRDALLTAEHIQESHQQTLALHHHEKPEVPIPNLGVLIAVILPISVLLSHFMIRACDWMFPVTASIHGLASVLSGLFAVLLSYFSGAIEGTIKERVPFGRLNPYFGRKLADSITTLKKHA